MSARRRMRKEDERTGEVDSEEVDNELGDLEGGEVALPPAVEEEQSQRRAKEGEKGRAESVHLVASSGHEVVVVPVVDSAHQ
jgi:hypothetical protein